MEGWLGTGLGIVAGLLSTASFVPQVRKAWRERDTEALSLPAYLVTVSAFALWVAYGVVIASMPIVVFNSLSLLLSGSILALKLRNRAAGHDAA